MGGESLGVKKERIFSDLRQSDRGRGELGHIQRHHCFSLVAEKLFPICSSKSRGKRTTLPVAETHTSVLLAIEG